MSIKLNKSWLSEVVLESSPSLFIIVITSLCNHSHSLMLNSPGSCLSLPISHFIYEGIGFHRLWFLLGLYPKWSPSSILCYCDPVYLLCVQLCAFTLVAMALVVRVEPNNTKLLDESPELLDKVEAVGWLPFIRKFADSNPEVTKLFSLSLVDARVKVPDL